MELWISIQWLVRSAKFRLSVGKEKQYCYNENWKIKKTNGKLYMQEIVQRANDDLLSNF